MTELISAFGVLGIVILALLIMTRTITVEDAAKAFMKAFAAILLLIFAIRYVSAAFSEIATSAGHFASWLALIALAILGILLAAWITGKIWVNRKRTSKGGEQYE